MGLKIKQSFDSRFVKKIHDLQEEYGLELFELDGIGPNSLDICHFSDKFFSDKTNIADVSIDANANVDDSSVLSFEYEYNKGIQKLNGYYEIWKRMADNPEYGVKRANKMLEHCITGVLKIHDQHMIHKPYCYAFSLQPLCTKGMPFIKKVKIKKPKHLSSFVNLVIQFTAYASNQLAGASAFPDFFVYFDWYARKDFGNNYMEDEGATKQVLQNLQSLVWSWNFPYRGSQSAFVNLNIYDTHFLKDLFDNTIYPDNSTPDFESIEKLQKLYARWFVDISKEQTFTFPVNTATFYKDENGDILDNDFLEYISELNCYNGVFNIFTGELGVLSSCCRLRNDSSQTEYMNSFGAGGVSIGSHRVVTLNLPHIGFQAEDDADYMSKLELYTKYAHYILDVQREILVENIRNKKLPLYTHEFMFLQKQFSTLGFIGINEACEIQGYSIIEDSGRVFARGILDKMNSMNDQASKKDGRIRNIEQIPGESAASMFALKDKLQFNNQPYDMYANQYIPLWKNVDIQDRIKTQGEFDSLCSGGAICHLNCTDSITPNQMKKLIVTAAKAGCIYYAVNMNMCRCNICDKLYIGNFEKSPCHDSAVTHYIRVVGFLTPVENWTPPRRNEYKLRQFYNRNNFAIDAEVVA